MQIIYLTKQNILCVYHRLDISGVYVYIYIVLVVQRIVTTEDRHDRRETLCLI